MLLGSYDSGAHAGIARAARECRWHLDVSVLKTFQLPRRWRGDGIITSMNRSQRLVNFVEHAKLPTVDLSIWRSDLDYPRVVADNAAIGEMAARHFLAFGHRHFAWFALSRNPVGELRMKGFRESLPAGAAFQRLDGSRANNPDGVLKRLNRLESPVAVFCRSDEEAAWLQNACLEGGLRVPDDVAILGVDNNELICLNQPVPLSSVNHDLERIGYEGALRLDTQMRGERFAETLLIRPDGVTTRQSTDALAVSDSIIRQALAFLVGNLREPIGTSDVAVHVGLSRRSLETRFRESLCVGVREKLIELRLREASRRLTETHDSIEDIAAWTGFANTPHLSRSFKAAFGVPPLHYRKSASASS